MKSEEERLFDECAHTVCLLIFLGKQMSEWHQGDGDIRGEIAREFARQLIKYEIQREICGAVPYKNELLSLEIMKWGNEEGNV